MPVSLTVALVVLVLAGIILRLAVPGLPLRSRARPWPAVDAVLFGLGALGLVGHCTAMFYPGLLQPVPGSAPYLDAVNGMGVASVVLYLVPAALVMIGLRRQYRPWLLLPAMALVAVGITMYDGGPVVVHLATIAVAGLLLVATTVLFVRPTLRRPRAEG